MSGKEVAVLRGHDADALSAICWIAAFGLFEIV